MAHGTWRMAHGRGNTDRSQIASRVAYAVCRCVLFIVAVVALSMASFAQQVVDRIVATVNGQPVLLSDWEVEMRFEALLDRKPLPVSDDDARAALDRLIDHELLRQQFKTYRLAEPSSSDVEQRISDLRKQLGDVEDAPFDALLARYGITRTEFHERVANQAAMLLFIDVRLRPSVHVDRRSIESYYYGTLVPEVKRKGQKPASLAEVSPQIEELLSQQRVSVLTADWLKDLRQQSKIHIDASVEMPPKAPETGAQ
jgi:hypothetical protein